LRLTLEAKQVLQAAAQATNRSLSQFVLESAVASADETLADCRTFVLDDEQWADFQVALDASPRPLPRLQRLFSEQGFFDSSATQ
jgi:uncharacterized protein (DUF1778 family)